MQAAVAKQRLRGWPLRGAVLLVTAIVLLCAACSEESRLIELPPLPPMPKPIVDAGCIPDGALACSVDSDCDDGIACSRDQCLGGCYCIHLSDHAVCNDGVFCNGDEVCDPAVGCVGTLPRRCNDEDACTIDFCDEPGKRCVNDVRDFDDDGEVDWHCSGGTDCDDFDATRSTALGEICGDGVDNDCDDKIDETLMCGRPEYDSCADALDVSVGGRFLMSLAGAGPDYGLRCGVSAVPDVAFTFTTNETWDVTLTVTGLLADGSEETAAVGLRTDCADVQSEFECSSGFPGSVRVRSLPAGTYFGIVSSKFSAQAVVDLRLAPATEAPSNTSCENPLDISAGGRFDGELVDVGDDESIACGFEQANDLVYVFTTEEERDVEILAISTTGERMNFAVRTDCDAAPTTIRCLSDAPARARLHQLPAGRYYLVLESSSSREVDFSLDVAFLPPTPPPPGDACSDPLDLPLETETYGTLANRQDLVDVICGCNVEDPTSSCSSYYADAVYRVKLDTPGDLLVRIDGGGAPMFYDIRSACEDGTSQLSCGNAVLVGARIRDLAVGEYFIVVESPEAANFMLSAEQLPRTMPVAVSGNNTCAQAVEIPESGGVWKGDTLTMLNSYEALCGGGARSNDAAFRLELTHRSRVVATLEATFDTVLYRFTDDGSGADSCVSKTEAACSDDGLQGNSNSALAESLDPGIYFYIIDGFNDNNESLYQFDVTVTPE